MKPEELQELTLRLTLNEAITVCPVLATRENKTIPEIFLDILKQKGYVILDTEEYEELKEKAWMYDELG